ncbi:MAG: hypothetical protein ACFCUR_14385 [Rhodomicrobiaceae bacterium]
MRAAAITLKSKSIKEKNSTPSPCAQPCETSSGWDAIEQDYGANELTVDEICAAHGVTRAQLYHRARICGWQLRRSNSLAARHRVETEFTNRLTTALDLKMTQFEKRIAEAGSAADNERDARTLNTLVRLFEKLQRLGSPATKAGVRVKTLARSPHAGAITGRAGATAASSADTTSKDAHDADRLRGQIGG